MIGLFLSPLLPASIGGAIEFIFEPQSSNVTGGKKVGGFSQVIELTITQLELTVLALGLSMLVALPVGLFLGHRGTGELLAVGLGNAGRAIPELALIAFMAAAIGVGLLNVTIAPLAGVLTLGDFIINRNVYGSNGVLAGAILVALLALALEFSLAGLQRLLTSKGLKLSAA